MSKFYTYEGWVEEFRPVANSTRDNGELLFGVGGDEAEYVFTQPIQHIWTAVDGDSGSFILSGIRGDNREGYFITEKPWVDEFTEVPTWMFQNCMCANVSEDGEPDPDCDMCDDGSIEIPCATVPDLIKIYGQETDVVR